MADDLDLDPRPLPPRDPRRSPAPVLPMLIALAVLLALAAGLFYRFGRRSGGAPETAEPSPPPAPTAAAPASPAPVAAPSPPLPELAASDPFVRERLGALSADAGWPAWLSADGLVPRFVAAASAVGEGKSPRQALDFVPVRGTFAVRTEGARTLIDAASFARYDGVARVLSGIDPEKARPLWRLLHPLLERAWAEIAPPDRQLDAVVLAGLDHLLATPVPPAEIDVVLADGLYRYVDPTLEALSPAQKHLVRMGAQNASQVREALRRLRAVI
jgi:hypothetical protein